MMNEPVRAPEQVSTTAREVADARHVQAFTTPKGITVWLLESHALPMVSMDVTWRGGSALEPADKGGLASLTSAMLDEGAGDMDATAFKEALERIGARMGANAGKLDMSMGLTTLTEHAPEAFRLFGLAATAPRVDADALERMRSATLASIQQGDEDPATVAWRLFRPAIFGSHPYARDNEGTTDSVSALTRDDVLAWHKQVFTRSNMGVVAVGDVTPEVLAKLVDDALGALPEGTGSMAVTEAPSTTVPEIARKHMPLPQGTVLLGHLGFDRHDPDYAAMLVMNEILGGGVLTSRMGADVREKNGLAYDVRSVNVPLPKGGMFYVSLATDNTKVELALELVRKHLNAIRDADVTDEEFNDAKAYLVGSFPLRIDSNSKLLNMLSMMQSEGMGTDYMETWPKRIAAVSKDDIRRVANRLIQPDAMALVVVGDGPALEAR